ncbi:MAG: SEC-C domain-containing protein, partial [Hungatella sp.]
MALLETWRNLAYGEGLDDKERENFWAGYFTIEKGIYEKILSNPAEVISGTVKELARKYETEVLIMTGFLDGINESLKDYENPLDTMEEDTEVKIEIDP